MAHKCKRKGKKIEGARALPVGRMEVLMKEGQSRRSLVEPLAGQFLPDAAVFLGVSCKVAITGKFLGVKEIITN